MQVHVNSLPRGLILYCDGLQTGLILAIVTFIRGMLIIFHLKALNTDRCISLETSLNPGR